MSLITGNDYFVTGVDIIEPINRSAPVLALPYATSHHTADELLDRLTEYTIAHFNTEDPFMAEYTVDPALNSTVASAPPSTDARQ